MASACGEVRGLCLCQQMSRCFMQHCQSSMDHQGCDCNLYVGVVFNRWPPANTELRVVHPARQSRSSTTSSKLDSLDCDMNMLSKSLSGCVDNVR